MYNKFTQHYSSKARTKSRARELRKNLTPAEIRFWHYVKNKQMHGFKFRRQHPLGNFIADFYCHELRLVVEIDGSIHELNQIKERDKEREAKIKELGLSVIRFSNFEVYYNPNFVDLTIKEFMDIKRREGL